MKMRVEDERLTPAEKLKAAEQVCADLNTALQAMGITLPSLWVEPIGYADRNPAPLIELGRCNLETARKLIAVLQTAQKYACADHLVTLASPCDGNDAPNSTTPSSPSSADSSASGASRKPARGRVTSSYG
jgi:hypothetical protein